MSRALRLIQSIGEALARPRGADAHANLDAAPTGAEAARPDGAEPAVVAVVRRLARGTRAPTQS